MLHPLVNHYGCAGDGDHDHAVGLAHRLVAKANSYKWLKLFIIQAIAIANTNIKFKMVF